MAHDSQAIIREFTRQVRDPRLVERPRVSVLMWAYNNVSCIRQSIDSVLMQKLNVDYELVISDDCSVDGTTDILLGYQARHPEIIRLLLSTENLWQRDVVTQRLLQQGRGTYIALTHGDDYWTSPHKLQKQIDFLDRHQDCALCGHRVKHVFEDGSGRPPEETPPQKELGTLVDILRWNYLPTASVVYRANLMPEKACWPESLPSGDWPMWVRLAEIGNIGFMNESMASYRVHGGGVWMGATIEKKMESLENTINAIHGMVRHRYPSLRRHALLVAYASGAAQYIERDEREMGGKYLWKAFCSCPGEFMGSPDVKRCAAALTHHFVISPIARRVDWIKDRYFRGRIWAGAKRRTLWRALQARFMSKGWLGAGRSGGDS